jgi:hypothetical protein
VKTYLGENVKFQSSNQKSLKLTQSLSWKLLEKGGPRSSQSRSFSPFKSRERFNTKNAGVPSQVSEGVVKRKG